MSKTDNVIFTLPIGANYSLGSTKKRNGGHSSENIWRGVIVGVRKGRNYEPQKIFMTIELNKDSCQLTKFSEICNLKLNEECKTKSQAEEGRIQT